jgi:hypothetical protein
VTSIVYIYIYILGFFSWWRRTKMRTQEMKYENEFCACGAKSDVL